MKKCAVKLQWAGPGVNVTVAATVYCRGTANRLGTVHRPGAVSRLGTVLTETVNHLLAGCLASLLLHGPVSCVRIACLLDVLRACLHHLRQ